MDMDNLQHRLQGSAAEQLRSIPQSGEQPNGNSRRLPGWRGGWWVALIATGLASCSGGGADAPSGPPHLLLVTVDTLRADHTSAYGYERETTPNLDQLAAEGVRFERAYSSAPFTAPSHASLFTGQVTQTHGVLSWGVPLDSGSLTLAEIAGQQGYATGAFYNHPSLEACELMRGFDHLAPEVFGPWQDTLTNFEGWLDGMDGDEPFCAWIHLWDVHRPYGYRNWFYFPSSGKTGSDREWAFAETGFGAKRDARIGRREQHYNVRADRRGGPLPIGGELAPDQRPTGSKQFDAADWQSIADRYDNGVRYVDEGIGHLRAQLEERGLLENTVLVITADHGETLTERPEVWFTHDPYLYEETLRVPLILRLPGMARGGLHLSTGAARSIDVLPTLLDWAGLESPMGIQGESLRGWIESGVPAGPRPVLSQTQTRHSKERDQSLKPGDEGWLEHRVAFIDGESKLIEHLDLNGETVRRELYDLGTDPDEQRDMALQADQRARVTELAQALDALRSFYPTSGSVPGSMTCEECLNLLRMGYVEDCSAYCD